MQKNLNIIAAFLALTFCMQMRLEAGSPVIASQPASETLYIGQTAQFTVQAGGDSPLAYQWLLNGYSLTDGGNVLGAANETLVISNVSATNTGSYQVVITNMSGAITSCVATLNQVAPFAINAVTYENAVIQANPVAYWRLNETDNPANGTVVAYDYWGGYNGIYGNASMNGVPGPCPANGINLFENSNTALLLTADTPNSCVALPPLNLNTNTITIACWVNPTTAIQANYSGVIFCRSGSTTAGLSYNNNIGSQLGFTWNNAADSYNWSSGLTPPAGQWSFVALVVTPGSATVYVYNTNGQSSSTLGIANAAQAFAGPTYIGVDPYTPARTFSGAIDEVAVFNYAMTQAQIAQLYNGATFAPAITSQPVSQQVYAGQSAQFAVGAVSPFQLYYQWQSNNVNLVDGANISGSATATLAITNVSTTNVASYQVIVSNAWIAVTSSVAALTLVPPISSTFESNILAANPVAYWRLNETEDPTSGTMPAYDYSGGHNGVYGSAVTLGVAGPDGLNFPGFDSTNTAMQLTTDTDDCWVTAPALNLDTNTVTITCWINPEAAIQSSYASLVSCRGGTTAAGLGFDNSGTYLGYTWNNDAGTYDWISGLKPPTNQWSFVALVVSPAKAVLYLCTTNGPQSATNFYPAVNQNFDGSTLIGNDPYNSPERVFAGAIEQVAIFNYALTRAQMTQLPDVVYRPIVTVNTVGQPQPLHAGDSYVLQGVAEGSPPLSYQWCLNSIPIPHATRTNLNFASVGVNDSGSYTLQVANPIGTSTSPAVVVSVDPGPIAQNSVAGTVENQPVTISTASLLALANDPYGDVMSVVKVTDSTNGATVLLEKDQIIYTPRKNFVGADRFSYTIGDTSGGTTRADVMVSVVPGSVMFGPLASAQFMLPNGCFHADYLGIPSDTYAVETATNVSGPWTFLTNLTAGTNGVLTIETCISNNAALFFNVSGGGPSGKLALATGQFPQMSGSQGNVILDTNVIQSGLTLNFPDLGTNIPLLSPTVLCSNANKLILQYSAVAPGGSPIEVTRTICLTAEFQKTVLLETMALTASGGWSGDIEIQRPFSWNQNGSIVQAFAPLSGGSDQQTDLSGAVSQWQYPLGYTTVSAPQLALPVMTFTSDAGRCAVLADPYYASLFEASLINGNVQGRVRYTYHTSQVPLGATETRQFGFVLAANDGFPGAFEDGLNDFYARMLPDVPPGPAWCKQIAMNGYDYLSDFGEGWTNDITSLAGMLTPEQRGRVVLCLHGWYDGLGSYSFDTNNNTMKSNWVAFGPTEQIPMSVSDLRFRMQYARTNGFHVLLYFADGLLTDSGGSWYNPSLVYHDTLGNTVSGWTGPDTFGATYAMNPANPAVINFYTNYLNALLATFGDLVDGFVWDETYYIRQGSITLDPAPAYCDVACMKLVKSLRARVKQYNPQMVFLASDVRGFVTDNVPGYAMTADGTYQDISTQSALFSYSLFENWRNTVWCCNWYPFSGFATSVNWVQDFGAPVPISNGWGDDCGPAEWTPVDYNETMTLFWQRLGMAPTTGCFLH